MKNIDVAGQESSRIPNLFEKKRTVCIGRHLIDVPMDADVIFGPAHVPYRIQRYSTSGRTLEEILSQRLKEILIEESERARGPLAKEGSMFGKVLDGAVPGQKIVFGAGRATGTFYRIQSYQIAGGSLYVQDTTAYDDDFRGVVDEMNLVAASLKSTDPNVIPDSAGVCIDGALILRKATDDYEAVTLGIRFRQFDDVHFSIEMTNKDRLVESDAIEPRLNKMEANAEGLGIGRWYKSIKMFRRGPRRIGQWDGFEVLGRKPALGDEKESHEFLYVSQGTPKNAMLPVLDVEMLTGLDGDRHGGKAISLSDAEAIELWDRLIKSIRPRRPAVSK